MEDKLQNFFLENDFNIEEPRKGHEARFEQRLQGKKNRKSPSWKWLSVAASITLIIGFTLGSTFNTNLVSPLASNNIQNVEGYFVKVIDEELKEIERNRSLETEDIIEEGLDSIEELEDEYKIFIQTLGAGADKVEVIKGMIDNYQKRLNILVNIIQQIEQVKDPKILDPDTII